MTKKKQVEFSVERPEQSLGFVFWQTTNLWQRIITKQLANLDLTHVQFVLLAGIGWLTRTEKMVTQTMLAQHAKTDIMMTSKVVRTLEQKKLIRRIVPRSDTRAKVLMLTKKGTEVLAKALKIVEKIDNDFFSPLGNQTDKFLSLLNKVLLVNQDK